MWPWANGVDPTRHLADICSFFCLPEGPAAGGGGTAHGENVGGVIKKSHLSGVKTRRLLEVNQWKPHNLATSCQYLLLATHAPCC